MTIERPQLNHDTTLTNDIMKDNEISTTDNPQPLSAHGIFFGWIYMHGTLF